MLSHPKPGQPVELRYAKKYTAFFPRHGQRGVVVTAGKKRPRNHLVRIGDELVVVPAGNLMKDPGPSAAAE